MMFRMATWEAPMVLSTRQGAQRGAEASASDKREEPLRKFRAMAAPSTSTAPVPAKMSPMAISVPTLMVNTSPPLQFKQLYALTAVSTPTAPVPAMMFRMATWEAPMVLSTRQGAQRGAEA